jgi:hypothetical protein
VSVPTIPNKPGTLPLLSPFAPFKPLTVKIFFLEKKNNSRRTCKMAVKLAVFGARQGWFLEKRIEKVLSRVGYEVQVFRVTPKTLQSTSATGGRIL